jgi:hypothetical protein
MRESEKNSVTYCLRRPILPGICTWNQKQRSKLTNRKFRQRFKYIEDKLRDQGKTFQDVSIDDLESLWQEAKEFQIVPGQ